MRTERAKMGHRAVFYSSMQLILIVVLGGFVFLIVIFGLLIGGNWLLAHFRRPRSPSTRSLQTYRERLRNPRWKELEEHFGTAIPEAIKNLYQQTGLLIERDVIFREKNDREWHIAEFFPADLESLEETWPDVRKSRNLPFARDFFDDCYYVDLQAGNSSRCPVMICHHDGSDVELVAGSLAEFLGWHRAR